jgi:biotin/methionine sulfoxide reductase
MGANDHWLSPSRKALGRYKEARDDYDVYTGLAERLGFADEFTEGRNADEWVEHLYCKTIKNAELHGVKLPSWEEFWSGDPVNIEPQLPARPSLQEMFRADPEANPLPESPSGKIEIFSEKIDSFGYQDCLGHPVWFEKREWLGAKKAQQFPLHLISNQPRTRLHSQYDHGRTSRDGKERERSVVRVNPADAQKRGIKDGDIVRLFNERGACLAAVRTTQRIRNDVIELPTGAWFDPEDPERGKNLDVHGNPNVLTQDVGSSSLGQGCSAHSCLVEMEIFDRDLPEIKVFKQPNIIT